MNCWVAGDGCHHMLQSWPPYQAPPRRPLRLEPGGRMPG